jgi:integrase
MRKGNRLTATEVSRAQKDLCDGDGLWLQVSQKYGTKAWIYRYQVDGVSHKLGLGSARLVSLKEARRRAAAARAALYDGADPIAERRAARGRRKLEAAKAITFKQCADQYIEANRASWKSATHASQWVSTFNETRNGRTVFPAATGAINDLPVSAIDTGLVLKVLEPIWRKTPETAARVRGRIERVLDWARVRGYREGENPARWEGHLKETLPPRSKLARGHLAALPHTEMPTFVGELRARPGVCARALEFAILTAARSGEVIGARWSEIDFQARLWVVPARRMKTGKEHRIPLSDRAFDILSSLPCEGEFVFPGARAGKPLSNSTTLELVRAMRGKGATVHGFRSTFKDWAGETTSFPNELTEIALAHAISDKTEAAYRRGDMMEKRRRLMADWADYCSQPAAQRGSNVRAIREAAT